MELTLRAGYWIKFCKRLRICAFSWSNTKIILRCTVSKESKNNTEYVNFTYCVTYAHINVQSVGHGYKIFF